MYGDILSFLPWNLFKSSDLSSMSNGLELRVPFCDRRLLPHSVEMSRQSIGFRQTKIPLRKLADHRGLSFISSLKKRGFSPPLRFLVDQNYDSVRESLSDVEFFSNFINTEYLAHILKSQFSGSKDYSSQIFALFSLRHWFINFVVG